VSAQRFTDRLSEYRSIAYRFREERRELVLNHIMKQLSVRKGLEHKVAREFLSRVKAGINKARPKRKVDSLIAMS
jgi:hypothetical protein